MLLVVLVLIFAVSIGVASAIAVASWEQSHTSKNTSSYLHHVNRESNDD